MPTFAIYDWSLYTTSLTQTELETSSHGNDPGQTGSNPYNSGVATWTGVDFTFNGGAPSAIEVADDDGLFEDAYVETGGAATLAQDVTINGVDYFAGDVVENEFSLIDPGGKEVWVVRINGVNVGFTYAAGEEPVVSEVFNADDTRDGDALDSLDQLTPSDEPYLDLLLCFAVGTHIEARAGPVAVETLRPGDLVWTVDRGLQPVRWVWQSEHRWTRREDRHKPILFPPGSLGAGLPLRPLIVSPQHRMLVPDAVRPQGMLCPAKAMTELPGVRQMRGKRSLDLIHILFDRHEIVLAEGAPSESFYPAPTALRALTRAERRAINGFLKKGQGCPQPARDMLAVRPAQARCQAGAGRWTQPRLAAAGILPPVPETGAA